MNHIPAVKIFLLLILLSIILLLIITNNSEQLISSRHNTQQIIQLPGRMISPVILTFQTNPLSDEEKEFIKKVNPYGFILFEYQFVNGIDPIERKKEIQELLNRNDIYFFVDQEGGTVDRLKGLYPQNKYPAASSFNALAKKNLKKAKEEVYKYGYRVGIDLKNKSFDVNIAPNAEIARTDNKGFMDSRCFSENPKIAKELSDSYAKGLKDAGIEPCYKHAIGIASAIKNPHSKNAVIVNKSLKELRDNQLAAFKNANKYKYLMIGHAVYPDIDCITSTYSPSFYKFVRKELNFKGLIITDALNMASAQNGLSIGDRMHIAVKSGADIVVPFFSYNDDFDMCLKEIKKIPKKETAKFNLKLKKMKLIF